MVALVLRGLVVTALVLAAAELQIVKTSDRLTVVYLLARNEIPVDQLVSGYLRTRGLVR